MVFQMSYIAIFRADYIKETQEQLGSFTDHAIKLLTRAGYKGEFKEFDVQHLEYPTIEELSNVKAVWITGSRSDSFADETWILKLAEYIKLYLLHKVPIVGICFGHQIVSRAMGVKVGRNPLGWELGVEAICLNEDPEILELFNDFSASEVNVLEVHQDVVFEIPEGCKNIGSSSNTKIQGLLIKNKLLTFQGHPEFEKEYVEHSLKNQLLKNSISNEFYEINEKKLESTNHDGANIGKVILRFIDNATRAEL